MSKPNLNLNEIKDLIGKPGVKLKVWDPYGMPMGEGELIGVLEQPSVILRDADGAQHHFAASQVYELVEAPLPEEPDVPAVSIGGRVWVRQGFVDHYHWEAPGFHAHSWLALNQLSAGVPIVPLVPDPADSAPVLPFELLDDEGEPCFRMSAHHSGIVLEIFQDLHEVDLSRDESCALAAAILRAARAAIGGQS